MKSIRVKLSTAGLVLGALLIGAGAVAAVVVYTGFYDVSASHQHLQSTYRLLEVGMRESVQRRARDIKVPPLNDESMQRRGLALYREHCLQCHGAPGVAPASFALGMTPAPAAMVHAARHTSAAEIYWITKNGIKMSGMPAWAFRMSEADMWAIVAFTQQLPWLTPQQYAALSKSVKLETPGNAEQHPPIRDVARGKAALSQYACTTCHQIPGVVGDHAPVGPPLAGMGSRQYIAGVIENTPENMVRWLREPQKISPPTAMPDLGVTAQDAWDMAAYLNSLK